MSASLMKSVFSAMASTHLVNDSFIDGLQLQFQKRRQRHKLR